MGQYGTSRPHLSAKRVTLDLDRVTYERLRKDAFDRHESVSAAARRILAAALPEPEPEPEPEQEKAS